MKGNMGRQLKEEEGTGRTRGMSGMGGWKGREGELGIRLMANGT